MKRLWNPGFRAVRSTQATLAVSIMKLHRYNVIAFWEDGRLMKEFKK